MNKKRIVICGSMSFYDQMVLAHDSLLKNMIPSVLPADDEDMALKLSNYQFEGYKRKVSFRYLEKIRDFKTWCVLVINPKLLFSKKINNLSVINTLHEIINRSYFQSYVNELDASIVTDLVVLESHYGITNNNTNT